MSKTAAFVDTILSISLLFSIAFTTVANGALFVSNDANTPSAAADFSTSDHQAKGNQQIHISKGVVFVGQPLIVSFGGQSGSTGNFDSFFGSDTSTDVTSSDQDLFPSEIGTEIGSASVSGEEFDTGSNSGSSDQQGTKQVSVQFLRNYLKYYGEEWRRRINLFTQADWKRYGNLNDENVAAEQSRLATSLQAWVRNEWRNNITKFDLSILNSTRGSDITQLRLFFRGAIYIGVNALSPERYQEWTDNFNNMTSIFGTGKICPFENQGCNKETDRTWKLLPDITALFQNSTRPEDYDKLLYMWTAWRDEVAKPIRPFYIRYVQLLNEGVRANGLADVRNGADAYQRPFFTPGFTENVDKLLGDIMPFYLEIHAFVRHRLRQHYGPRRVELTGLIPAHILGTEYGEEWQNIFPIVTQFNPPELNVTSAMREKNFNVRRIFDLADEFFVSLGLPGLKQGAPRFFELSRLEPSKNGTEGICHPTAWDFYATNKLPGDFRINQCAIVDQYNLAVAHHEMGHIQYFMQYVIQNPVFRDGPHPGFHEALGDLMTLSLLTPKHLKKIGLIRRDFEEDTQAQLAFLLRFALEKIPFLAYAYAVDTWRWKVFNGTIPTSRLNTEYWNIRRQIQGIRPPRSRSETDFDPAAKFHVVFDVDFTRYYYAYFLQFQFHQTLCEASGQFDPLFPDRLPLHRCDIGGSKAAGRKLKRLMEVGSSQPWQEVLFEMSRTRSVSAQPILTYFRPLRAYLQAYLVRNKVPMGWGRETAYLTKVGNF